MSTGRKLTYITGAAVLSVAFLCAGSANAADSVQTHTHKKTKKTPPPPLPSGPTGVVPQMPLDSIAAVPPQVSFANNQLTIVAPNSTLADILKAVRKQTGAEIDVPSAPDRVVTHLGPGPARDVVADLLNGSRFNYVLLGSPGDDSVLTRVVLVPKSGGDSVAPAPAASADGDQSVAQAENAPADQDASQDSDAEQPADDNTASDDSDQQAADGEQQQAQSPEQPGVRTPQQMLQEMQQRQMQLQQQQPPGQPPIPGGANLPHPQQPDQQ